ncbi:PAS domain S-box protein [uncultured Draconibacterium sp.]|uniref:PAS domain S-box protein n=1 Tax=uncultured Draconibacterium sp. TaxID=1573823 RepID=UPI0025FFD7FE|nr:PAS domain S-box protein [uncultured Draconibacterium sp.]
MANNSITILVIDDLQDNLITLNALIKDAFPEATVLKAQNGKTGLELAAKENPDVILLDILMPGMDGYEVCQKLKADKELCDIPVVFVTAIENNKEALVKALDSGGEAFLTKPIDEIELTAQIRAMLKIREANQAKKDEKVRLEKLVEKRSKELVRELEAHKKTLQELRIKEAEKSTILQTAIDGFWIVDKQGKFIDVNDAACKMLGYSKEEMLKMSIQDVEAKETAVETANRIKNIIKEGSARFESKHKTKKGQIINVEVSTTWMNSKSIFFAFLNDITERKQTEEERERIFNQSFDMICTATMDGYLKELNPAWEKTLGWTPVELRSKPFIEFIHPDDQATTIEAAGSLQNGIAALDFENRFQAKDGSYKWLSWNTIPILEKNMMLGFARDITESKQAEEEVSKLNALLKQTGELAKIGGWELDLQTNLFYFTDEMYQIYEITPGRILSLEEGLNLYPPETQLVFQNALADSKERNVPFTTDALIITKQNNKKWVRAHWKTKQIEGKVTKLIGTLQDITERKQAENEIIKVNRRLKISTESAGIGIWDLDLKKNVLTWDKRMFELYGIESESFEGAYEAWKKGVHPSDIERSDKEVQAAIAGEKEFHTQFRVVWPDGQIRFIEAHAIVNYDPDGTPKNMVGVNWDITEPKQAEEANKELLNRFELIGLHLPGVIYQFRRRNDGSYHFPYASHGITMIYGVTPEEVEHDASKAFKAIHTDDLERVSATINHSAQTLKPWHDVYRVNQPSGKIIWVEGNSTPIKLEDGSIIWHGFIQDITKRKHIEESLFESEERFKLAMNASNDGIFDWNLLTNEIYYSPGWKKMLGYEDHELPNDFSVWETTTEPEDVKKSWELQQKLISKKVDRFEIEFKMKHKDGHWVDILSRAKAIFNDKGKAIRIVGTHTDITERKQFIKTIQERNKYIESIMENMPIGFALNTINDGDVKYMNLRFEEIYGWSRNILTNTSIFFEKVFPEPKYREKMQAQIVADMQSGDPERMRWNNLKIVTSTGDVRYVYAYNIPLSDQNLMISTVQDVTERKLAEEKIKAANRKLQANEKALKASEERLDLAMMVKNEGIWDWYLVNNRVDFDQRYYAMAGYEPDDFANNLEEFQKRIHPEDVDYVMSTAEQYLTGQIEQFQVEFRFNRKDGSWMWIQGRGQIVERDEKGIPIRFIGTHSDITKRKQAEAELLKLSTAVTQSPSVIAITDTKGTLEYVNPQFTESTGYSMEEAIGQNPRVLKSGEQSDEMYKELWGTISSGKIWRGEFHNKKKNGELFWEIASVSPIFDEQGKIINYIKVAEDITERKQAEDNFRHSIDESPLGIRIVSQEGKTVYVNKALLDIYEFSTLDEFLNTRAIETYTEQSYQEHLKRKKIRQKGGDAYDYEISIRRKKGEIRHIKVWRKEVIWNREKHFQVINQDITELKRLNTDLILAKEKAEESNRLKTAFLNNMSHEIRTPLNGITGFIGLLQDSDIADEQKQHYFDIINKSSDRLITTVTDIMDISRIEAGEIKVSKTEVSVNEILKEQYNFFYHQAKSKGLQLIYKPGLTDSEARFVTDKHKLEGILTNLIKNAIKFTEHGEITFAYSLKKEQDIDVLEFTVKDTGIGIPTNRIDAVFNRFEQADIEDSKVHQGSGLGLAIAKSYVEMLGGDISVSSEVGLGTTFTFSIPYTKQLVKESDAKKNNNKETQTALSNLSVIIAEDDEASTMYFEAIFRNEFENIIYAKTGKETVDKCRENPDADLILMDIKMPGMNGYDATREIRKFNKDVIIIAQTAFGLTGDREKAIAAGCNDYIAKPIKKEELEIIIKNHFKN